MTLLREFQKHKHRGKLKHRLEGFEFAINHLDQQLGQVWIFETGTARIRHNWEGDGQSTLIWDWCMAYKKKGLNLTYLSIDINPEAVRIAAETANNGCYKIGDSVACLNSIPKCLVERCKLLYLDSFDWSEEHAFASEFHHMMELATIWSHLPSGCLIMVDDCHPPTGKHILVQRFFDQLKIKPAIEGYQIGWIKP